jgi:hypothetical protein
MARKRKSQGLMIVKVILGVVLAVVAYVGLKYESLLKEMDAAAVDYSKGDLESALKRYEGVEENLRNGIGMNVLRYIPAKDRQNLLLNQA